MYKLDNFDDNQLGAIKIKDGLFIGDELAAKDLEFIVTNKVTHVINSSGKQIANLWENIGVQYLTLFWQESDSQILFDPKNETVNEIIDFIKEAHEMGESILVHSVRGQSRACCVLAVFFMIKYKWTLYKTLEYLNSRRPDLEIRASFFHQLTQLEQRLQKSNIGACHGTWEDNNDPDDDLIKNTFLNAKKQPFADYMLNITKQQAKMKKNSKIHWADHSKKKLTQVLRPKSQSMHSGNEKRAKPQGQIVSILKGSKSLTFMNHKNLDSEVQKLSNSQDSDQFGSKSFEIIKNLENSNLIKQSSSFCHDEKQERKDKTSTINPENLDIKLGEQRINHIQGNIIHLTVNNFMNANNIQDKASQGRQQYEQQMSFQQQKQFLNINNKEKNNTSDIFQNNSITKQNNNYMHMQNNNAHLQKMIGHNHNPKPQKQSKANQLTNNLPYSTQIKQNSLTYKLYNNQRNLQANNTMKQYQNGKSYPIKASQEFIDHKQFMIQGNNVQEKDRPSSAQIQEENNNKQLTKTGSDKQRPASSGIPRHFSPGSKAIQDKQMNGYQIIPNMSNKKGVSMRYPSPQVNGNGSSYTSIYKWK